ncbi:DnaJ domain-containing protein [Phlyctochytrium arcticum]|nr:DnaJ domain-containing protein [Phlyctochytrium arcticum]
MIYPRTGAPPPRLFSRIAIPCGSCFKTAGRRPSSTQFPSPRRWDSPTSPYEVLDVRPDVRAKELKSQYYKLSMNFHPDRTLTRSESDRRACHEKYIQVQNAYALLSDPVQKAEYDRLKNSPRSSFLFRPEKQYGRFDGGYDHEPSPFSGDGGEPMGAMKILAPWFMGFGTFVAVAAGAHMYIAGTQTSAEEEAWEEYIKARERDGLAEILGYRR